MTSYPLTTKVDDVIEVVLKEKASIEKKLGYDDAKRLASALFTAWDLLSDYEGASKRR